MKIVKQFGHQGDTQWFEIDQVPADAKKIEKQFIAASERTGSVHALCGDYDLYQVEDGFVVKTNEECVLNHTLIENLQRELGGVGVSMSNPKVLPPKDHRHSVLPKGRAFFVGIHRKADPINASYKKVVD